MFDGFEQAKDDQARKRWFASAGTSMIIYAVVGLGILILVRQTVTASDEEQEVDVTFATSVPEVEVEKKLEKKVEPPKPAAPKPKKAGRAAPPPPTRISNVQPEEATPTERRSTEEAGVEELGEGGTGLELGGTASAGRDQAVEEPPPPPPPPRIDRDPDLIIEDDPEVTRAERIGGQPPVYPEQARHAGREAVVIVELRITAAGDVKDVELVEGEEPFAAAALEAVKTWRYKPATRDGRPIAVARRVRIPFEIKG